MNLVLPSLHKESLMANKDVKLSVLLENVVSLIHQKFSHPESSLIEKLALSLYQNTSQDDLSSRNDNDLYGAALSLWNQLNQIGKGEKGLRVLNPSQSKHGWQSTHSIIEIIHPDMPFLIDSIMMVLNRLEINAHMLSHMPFVVNRKNKKITEILKVSHKNKHLEKIAVISIEIDRQNDDDSIMDLENALSSALNDVEMAVNDWQAMSSKLSEIIAKLPYQYSPSKNQDEITQACEFLSYLNQDHFTFLGYRYYEMVNNEGHYQLVPEFSSSLGILPRINEKTLSEKLSLSTLPINAQKKALDQHLLVLSKSRSKSRVHRPANIDYIGIKRFDKRGNVIGEDRFLGLYASNLYNSSPTKIPLLANKVQSVLALSELSPKSHNYKALINILENLPRDELIQSSIDDLVTLGKGVLQIQERDKLKLFVRKDSFGRFFSCLVYVAKERYSTSLRKDTQRILAKSFHTQETVEFTTYFSESRLARTHYIVTVDDNNMDIDVASIEDNLIEATRSWEDRLYTALNHSFGENLGNRLYKKYLSGFSSNYKSDVLPSAAVVDMQQLEKLNDTHKLGMLFYQPQEHVLDDKKVRLKLFHKDEPIHLSDMLPMLENFGLRVINERPYEIKTTKGDTFWVLDFLMMFNTIKRETIAECQQRFQIALADVWNKKLEDDGFNSILLATKLTGREVSVIRAYAKYMRQIDATFSQTYIEETFSRYPDIAELLVKLFIRKFNPKLKNRVLTKLQADIVTLLEGVASLDDDRIIHRYLDLINATVRTNFYQLNTEKEYKDYISFKFLPNLIPDLPQPLPEYEIFVYSPRMEGVHLRGGKVARGGLRWSDRREDFRTEVLGLVKAQQVKNTVIVPVGAKGGFVCKQLRIDSDRETTFEEGKYCYQLFIRGLLDITDNIVNGDVYAPIDVFCHDENDPYLVVAADKGTATFSDIANKIALEYKFWLGDAFASGGSHGYDHKKMGITARGAWESVKRHFREVNIDCQQNEFTCLGIGDMAGDVFGNGMLLSPHTLLVAAFNHLHIFIDPKPNAKQSYQERQRLFALPRSNWNDYNEHLLSKGGGIFSRSAKSIPLSAEIKLMLNTKKSSLTPNELIKFLLKMPVDLIWNGGIGTYIKSKSETHLEVGDRANDLLRVDGCEVKARIIGEGGNLGCTQLGRIEYASAGGRINTDFVDNVGGVDCSDNEVNIKILLNSIVNDGDLTLKQRNHLLQEMTDDVAHNVLIDCINQTRTISVTEVNETSQLKEYVRFIQSLEKEGKLDRNLEFLPSDDELSQRQLSGTRLTRPELSVLVAYAKMILKEQLITDEIVNDPYFSQLLTAYFPKQLQQDYHQQMINHPLRKEIIAMSLANQIVNDMGFNFVQRMQDETGASVADTAICYAIAREVFGLNELTDAITGLNGLVSATIQGQMLHQLRRTLRRSSRWFQRHRDTNLTIEQTVAFYKPVVEDLKVNLMHYMIDAELAILELSAKKLIAEHVPEAIADQVSKLNTLFSSLDVAQIAASEEQTLPLVAEIYYKLGAHIDLHWFLDQITLREVNNHWQALARAAFREELDWQQRSLTSVILANCKQGANANEIIMEWIDENQSLLARWFSIMTEFKASKSHEFAKFSVALRELNLLILHCERQK